MEGISNKAHSECPFLKCFFTPLNQYLRSKVSSSPTPKQGVTFTLRHIVTDCIGP